MNPILLDVSRGDHELRPVLADWYEDAGDGERAAFWRASAEGVDRIDALSPVGVELLAIVRDEWLRVGSSSGRTDRAAAESCLPAVYAAGGLPPPSAVVWLDGPVHGAVAAAILSQVRGQVWDQVGDQVWGQVRGQVRDQVWDQVRDQVRSQVRGQVWDQVGGQVGSQVRGQVGGQIGSRVRGQVWDQVWGQVRGQVGGQVGSQVGGQIGSRVRGQVWDQVGSQVWGQVWDQVGSQVWGQVRSQVMDQVDKCGFGTHDASWLSFYSCFDLLGLRSPRLLRPLFALSRATGWWWPFSNVCVLTDLPTRLVMRDKKLVRIDYADGLVIER